MKLVGSKYLTMCLDGSAAVSWIIRTSILEDPQNVLTVRSTIVNLGDAFQRLTGGHYKSSLHRVINRSAKHRYSIPFFFDGNLDTVLKPVFGLDTETQHLTVEEHMKERMSQSRKRTAKDVEVM